MSIDSRSHRVALLNDDYVNGARHIDGLAVTQQLGWGIIQLPAAEYAPFIRERALAEIAQHVEEFAHHGYDVVVIGDCEGLEDAFELLGVPLPDRLIPTNTDQIVEFLKKRPAPAAQGANSHVS